VHLDGSPRPGLQGAVRARLGRALWDLERFGITPRGLVRRLRPGDGPRVLSISIPKAGTHLVERALCSHPDLHRRLTRTVFPQQVERLEHLLDRQRAGEVICAHLHSTERVRAAVERHAPRVLFVVRDPRDVVVSQAHYVAARRDHAWHDAVRDKPDLRERVRVFIDGDPDRGISGIGRVLDLYSGWLDLPGVRVVRYENLIDPEARPGEVAALFGWLGVRDDPGLAARIARRLISSQSVTFRRGKTGEWREVMDDELLAAFQRAAGDRLARYGYA